MNSCSFVLTAALAACSVAPTPASAPPAPGPVPASAPSALQAEPLKLRWLGGPSATLERAGLRVLTDPTLGPRADVAFTLPRHPSSGVLNAPVARYTSPPAFDPTGLTAILISHTHNDHFDATAQSTLDKALPVVVAAAGAAKVRAAGFKDVRPLDWGESLTLTAGRETLKLTGVPAHHAHDPALDAELGKGNGYVLEWSDASGTLRVYWTGDAVLSDESRDFATHYGAIDLLLPHLGGVGGDGGYGLRTMNAEEAIGLVERVHPKLVIPIHHTTFAHYREPIAALEERAREANMSALFHFLREGEAFELPERSSGVAASSTTRPAGFVDARGASR